jgi:hypothetical protein
MSSSYIDEQRCSLLPTKVYSHFQANKQTVHVAYPNSPSKLTAQPVLQWIESLSSAADGDNPILVDGVRLSEPTPSSNVEPVVSPDHVLSYDIEPSYHPEHWDLTYMYQRDPFGYLHTATMSNLAGRLESLPAADMAAYYVVQTRLEAKFDRVVAQFPYGTSTEYGELRLLLDTIYKETIHSLRALTAKASDTTVQPHTLFPDSTSVTDDTAGDSTFTTPTVVLPKKDFASYMTSWLRDNWTNPYPDEDGLAEMALATATTPVIVSNWLINARTRKWRPAIVKATELDRPTHLLLEDSIRIFDGETVRDLDKVVDRRGAMKRRKMEQCD